MAPDQKPFIAATQAKPMNALDANVASAREAIAGASDADPAKTWTLFFGGHPVLSMPDYAVSEVRTRMRVQGRAADGDA